MAQHSGRFARIAIVVLGLIPATACGLTGPKAPCEDKPYTQGPVTVMSETSLRSGASEDRVIAQIPAGETIYPETKRTCTYTGAKLRVDYRGKLGWIAESHVTPAASAPPTASPTATPRPTPTR